MSEELSKKEPLALQGKALEEFVVRGNLAALSPADKSAHYIQLCNSLGLNPATKPFEFLTLQGREILYARRECTEQLRKIHNVSLEIVAREHVNDVYVVTARAMMPDGRRDESTGAVSIAGLKGDAMANKLMVAETKAKRRVTLSICGLGFLDESEVETINRFENLRKESTPTQVDVVELDPFPPIPEHIGMIPANIMRSNHARLNGLGGVKLDNMSDDDLDLVYDVCRKAYAAAVPRGAPKLETDWLKAIAVQSKATLESRNNPPPPVSE